MRLLFIRHGEPDYSIDSLTPKGWKEAECLADKLVNEKMDYIYVSPLGRAKDTAGVTLKKLGREAVECPWLEEFPIRIQRPDMKPGEDNVAWDWIPEDWVSYPDFYDKDKWFSHPLFVQNKVPEKVDYICSNLDKLLEKHGYIREGMLYTPIKANNDTIVFFCHFAVSTVMIGHLLGISPMVLWHTTCAAPTSVTTIYTEERRKGKAIFRMNSFGDVSHLYAKNEEVSFAARFCECYDNADERHD